MLACTFTTLGVASAGCGSEPRWTSRPDSVTIGVNRGGIAAPTPVTVVVRVDGGHTFVASIDTDTEGFVPVETGEHDLSVTLLKRPPDGRMAGSKLPEVWEATQRFDSASPGGLIHIELVANGSPSGYEVRIGSDRVHLGKATLLVAVPWHDAVLSEVETLLEQALQRGEAARAQCIALVREQAVNVKFTTDRDATTVSAKAGELEGLGASARACETPPPPSNPNDICQIDPSVCQEVDLSKRPLAPQ
ncbi:MAG: hypothetical protein U0414_33935 [Polyangiaceae bacterium]